MALFDLNMNIRDESAAHRFLQLLLVVDMESSALKDDLPFANQLERSNVLLPDIVRNA